jgi:hypothetical protein
MRIAFQNGTIHKCTRIPFIRIAGNIFLIADRNFGELPFQSGRESTAPSSAQSRFFDFIDHLLGRHFFPCILKCKW